MFFSMSLEDWNKRKLVIEKRMNYDCVILKWIYLPLTELINVDIIMNDIISRLFRD